VVKYIHKPFGRQAKIARFKYDSFFSRKVCWVLIVFFVFPARDVQLSQCKLFTERKKKKIDFH